MLKRTETFTDFDGNTRTEDFYFNLTKAELTEMQMSEVGGLEKRLRGIIMAQDGVRIMSFFKDILLKSYGVKSADGRRFIKNDEVRKDFEETEAYSQIFMDLVTDADKMADFIKAVIPSDLSEQVDKEMEKQGNIIPMA
ncbi:MAG: hypothetical protein J6Y02_16545 [Pseudobutyrivibrio sp.]|nr:hypothetical protein [Pseudobutyrivibrio sp.]